jgi:hypothetical protein
MIISIAKSGKSPLSPLFQRGELAVERAELPNTHRAKLYLPSWIIPPLKKGDKKGDLNFFTASGDVRGGVTRRGDPLRCGRRIEAFRNDELAEVWNSF